MAVKDQQSAFTLTGRCVTKVFMLAIFQWMMLYLVSVDKLKGEGKELAITKEEFSTIYMDILQNGKSNFNGQDVSLSPGFKKKGIDYSALRDSLELLQFYVRFRYNSH